MAQREPPRPMLFILYFQPPDLSFFSITTINSSQHRGSTQQIFRE